MSEPKSVNENNSRDEGDDALLARYRQGDQAAFDALYERVAGRLFAFALQLTQGRRADAEDLVQETFVAAYRGMGGFRGGSRVLTWLFGIMARRSRDNRRRPQLMVATREETDEDVSRVAASPENAALSAILLQEAIARLDAPQREAFLLVAAQGLTHKEAAGVLGAPVGTVKWRVAEAMRRLRVTLTDEPIPNAHCEDARRASPEENDESEKLLKVRP